MTFDPDRCCRSWRPGSPATSVSTTCSSVPATRRPARPPWSALMTFYGLLWAAGGNDLLAINLSLSINQITYFMRVAVFVLPVVAFFITRRWCISLQRHDQRQAAARLRDRHHHALPRGWLLREAPADQPRSAPTRSPPGSATRSTRSRPRSTRTAWPPAAPAPSGSAPGCSALMFADNIQKPTREELEEAHAPRRARARAAGADGGPPGLGPRVRRPQRARHHRDAPAPRPLTPAR